MNANKQLINLAGVLLVVVLLVAGVALLAMPMYSQAQTIDGQTRTVAQNNGIYEQQLAQLAEAEARIEEIDAEVATLRTQISETPQLDDVHQLLVAAAKKLDLRVVSVTADDPEPWTPRDALDEDGNAVVPEEPAESAAEAGTDAATGDPADDSTADGEEAPAAAPVAEEEVSPQQQLLVTITINATLPFALEGDDASEDGDPEAAADEAASAELNAFAAKAAAYVDALGDAKRLVTPIDVSYIDGTLVVSVLAYFRMEDAS